MKKPNTLNVDQVSIRHTVGSSKKRATRKVVREESLTLSYFIQLKFFKIPKTLNTSPQLLLITQLSPSSAICCPARKKHTL